MQLHLLCHLGFCSPQKKFNDNFQFSFKINIMQVIFKWSEMQILHSLKFYGWKSFCFFLNDEYIRTENILKLRIWYLKNGKFGFYLFYNSSYFPPFFFFFLLIQNFICVDCIIPSRDIDVSADWNENGEWWHMHPDIQFLICCKALYEVHLHIYFLVLR